MFPLGVTMENSPTNASHAVTRWSIANRVVKNHFTIAKRLVFAISLLTALGCVSTSHDHQSFVNGINGAWRNEQTGQMLYVHDRSVLFYETVLQNKELVVVRVLTSSSSGVTVRFLGLLEHWNVVLNGKDILLDRGCGAAPFKRLPSVPSELTESPFRISPSQNPVSEADAKQVADEMNRRLSVDQKLRKTSAPVEQIRDADTSNRKFLHDALEKYGWIDVRRFGPAASCTAAIFINHIGALSLESAAAPFLERDITSVPDISECYMVVLDKLRLQMGESQRFGSQICKDRRKEAVVCSLETPSLVDTRRTAVGAPPMKDYLQSYSKLLYGGRPIAIPPTDVAADFCPAQSKQ